MSRMVTKGDRRNSLSRTYDRLRKRSQRKLSRSLEVLSRDAEYWRRYGDMRTVDALVDQGENLVGRHQAYVEGVRDALNAIGFEVEEAYDEGFDEGYERSTRWWST